MTPFAFVGGRLPVASVTAPKPSSPTPERGQRRQVRCTVVCSGAAQILEVLDWLLQSGLRPCRVKNKFAMASAEVVGGYRDLMVCLLFEDPDRHAAPPALACTCLNLPSRDQWGWCLQHRWQEVALRL